MGECEKKARGGINDREGGVQNFTVRVKEASLRTFDGRVGDVTHFSIVGEALLPQKTRWREEERCTSRKVIATTDPEESQCECRDVGDICKSP